MMEFDALTLNFRLLNPEIDICHFIYYRKIEAYKNSVHFYKILTFLNFLDQHLTDLLNNYK